MSTESGYINILSNNIERLGKYLGTQNIPL